MKQNHSPEQADAVQPINEAAWTPLKKFSFRFFFLFFGLNSHLIWFAIIYIYQITINKDTAYADKAYKPLIRVCHWLDKHIYHTGFDPKIHIAHPGDGHFGLTLYITVLVLSATGAILWSIIARKRTNYNRLFYWFCLYLRYSLAIAILGYGFDKLIPIQMHYPRVSTMLTPYGYQDKFSVLWNFMGVSPGYQIFSGVFEVIAGLLLFSRRTAVAGYVLITGILLNVVALNIFYNVTVKIFSTFLLFVSIFLLAPYLNNISSFFFRNKAALLSQKHYVFHTQWKKYLLTAVLILVPFVLMFGTINGIIKRYDHDQVIAENEKVYDVTDYSATDSLPPITADSSSQWKRVLLNADGNYTVIFWVDDDRDTYETETDSVKQIITLRQQRDSTFGATFHYTYPAENKMELTGHWEGREIKVSLKLFSMKRMYLNRDTIKLIKEH